MPTTYTCAGQVQKNCLRYMMTLLENTVADITEVQKKVQKDGFKAGLGEFHNLNSHCS